MGLGGAKVELRLLGPVEATSNGRALVLGGRRQRTLLALLAVGSGRTASAERLADELWHGQPPTGAATTVRSYVSRLRAALGAETVVSQPSGYGLQMEPVQIDVYRFEQLMGEGRQALARGAAGLASRRLRAALALWRGPALADVNGSGTLSLEAWRLDELRLACVSDRIEADLVLGRHLELVAELERLVHDEPLRERAWRQLILALYRSGRQADALSAYRRARHELAGLGLEPGAELVALERAVLRHEVVMPVPVDDRHNIPAPISRIVGRDRELNEVEALLADHRLVTLTGMGGTGKTTVAVEAAMRQVGAWPAGVWLVDLTTVTDPVWLPDIIATTLGVAERPGISATDALAEYLQSAELLLVLDNCEHLAAASAELLDTLLGRCRALRVLATSRVPLSIRGEYEFAVDPLPLPPETATVADIERSPAVQLFLDRGRAVRRNLAATPEGLAAVAHICRELDGLPLAIELAAARAKLLTLDEIAARLADRFRFLRARNHVPHPRHQTMQATMDWSYELLTDRERTLLRGLSVFANGFTLRAAAAVCLDSSDGDAAEESLGRLVDASLVRAEETAGGMRYRLLETVRQYGAQRLAAEGTEEQVRRDHASFFLSLAASSHLSSESVGEDRFDLVIPEEDNLRAAMDWASAGDLPLAARLTVALELFWVARSPFEGERRLAALLAATTDMPPDLHASVMRIQGGCTFIVGRFDDGNLLYERSLAEFQSLGDEGAAAGMLQRMALSAYVVGDLGRARALAEESLVIADRLENKRNRAAAVGALASVTLAEGDVEAGLALFERSAALAGEARFNWWQTTMTLNLASHNLRLGRFFEAGHWARATLASACRIGERRCTVYALALLACVAIEAGNTPEAGLLWGALEREERRGPVGQWEEQRKQFAAAATPSEPDDAYERARIDGGRMTLDEAITRALRG